MAQHGKAGSIDGNAGSIFVQLAAGAERLKYKSRHTGIVVSADPATMHTMEGNTNEDGSAEAYEARGFKNTDFIML